jgi:glucose/arabinose dehydrogenase
VHSARALALLPVLLAVCGNGGGKTVAPGAAPATIAAKLELVRFARLKQPLDLDAAPGDTSGKVYVVEKGGRVRIVLPGGAIDDKPFLDLSDRVSGASEQGLLGLAFHPRFADNGKLYLNFTDKQGDTRVIEVDTKHGNRERELLVVDQPYSNHNGGHLTFGPDGKLWVGLGDGGAANDPKGNGQKDGTYLGKMTLLDVDAASPAAKIHMKGLRNPWRYEFDPKTGDLYIGDVGQNIWEELDVVPAAEALRGGQNFGWNVVEGNHCFSSNKCDKKKYVAATLEYAHDPKGGCSVTGGFVYRGKALPELDGTYFYADYCTAWIRGLRWRGGKISDSYDWSAALDPARRLSTISAFGQDADGELYVLSLDGWIYKLVRKT